MDTRHGAAYQHSRKEWGEDIVIATMSETGIITLQAETSVEAYALKFWSANSEIKVDDLMRGENHYWRGTKLKIQAAIQKDKGKS
jgi:hypothetical protein